MKLVINVPDYVKEQADDGKGEELGIPLWLAYEIANGTPLPKGHGDLIDKNIIANEIEQAYKNSLSEPFAKLFVDFMAYIDDAPTIIEADKGESEE